MRLDTNVQNHERIGGFKMRKRLEHQRKDKRTYFELQKGQFQEQKKNRFRFFLLQRDTAF